MNQGAHKVIVASHLITYIKNKQVLKDLTFSVQAGKIFALLGGNGAGKTTTLKTLLGLNETYEGDAHILGLSVRSAMTEIRKKVAYLPESVMLYPHLSGIENIEYFLSLAGLNKDNEHVHVALDKVGLKQDARQQPLANYSKGMRQKTAIALALLREAPVLLLDEPTSGLDPLAIDEFNALVSELAEAGTTVLMVTHDVYGACQIADNIGLLHQGALVGSFSRKRNAQGYDSNINIDDVHEAFIEKNR
jgi:ABC-2 type transport system ATP-binding protein